MSAPDSPHADRSAGNRRAIAAMIGAMAFFSIGDLTLKVLGGSLPAGQTILTRGVFAIGFVLVIIKLRRQRLSFAQLGRPIILARSACEGALVALYVPSLAHMKLGVITSISQATPILMTALAALVLKETVGWRRWSATAIGFAGVLLVARPGPEGFNPWALTAFGATILVTTRDLITRFVPADTPTGTVALGTTIAAALGSFALAPFEVWRAPTGAELALCALAAAMTSIGNLFVIASYRTGEISVISPFRYVIIAFSLVWGFLAFGERPTGGAIVGIAMIVGAGLYTLHRERVRARAVKDARRP